MMQDTIIDFIQIFEVVIITSSICFAGIIHHSIILHILLVVSRLLCAL